MIKINTVKILNFRSFRKEKNHLNKLNKINVIVGKNNVGKTNVLRAIYLFFNPELYDIKKDRNIIKVITGGGSQHPKITLSFEDDELIDKKVSYDIICDLNVKGNNYYSIKSAEQEVYEKLKSSNIIKKYINDKFKCVYLSTTDEDIQSQSSKLIKDLILEYFKKQNKDIRETIDSFEKAYKELIATFDSNINSIENDLSNQFIDLNDTGVMPRLSFNSSVVLTDFLLENLKLQLDDTYIQDISEKGAGVQRASLVMLSIYLLNQIYTKQNKLILLD